MRLIILVFLSLLAISISAKSNLIIAGGYTDSLGRYKWLTNDMVKYEMAEGKSWYLVSENKKLWQEAICIRNANIQALILLGFDSLTFHQDIFLYPENSVLFTKLSYLQNSYLYIGNWKKALNSEQMRKTAKKSKKLKVCDKSTRLVLKHYAFKAGDVNALGIVRKGFIAHSFEASMELMDAFTHLLFARRNPHQDLLFDAHIRNAKRLLKKSNTNILSS